MTDLEHTLIEHQKIIDMTKDQLITTLRKSMEREKILVEQAENRWIDREDFKEQLMLSVQRERILREALSKPCLGLPEYCGDKACVACEALKKAEEIK